MKSKLPFVLPLLLLLALAACRREDTASPIAPPSYTPDAGILAAAAEAVQAAQSPPAPWIALERTELAPAKGEIFAAFAAGGATPLPPDRLALHSAIEPLVTRHPTTGIWKITFRQPSDQP